jgi:hypothetical protein
MADHFHQAHDREILEPLLENNARRGETFSAYSGVIKIGT